MRSSLLAFTVPVPLLLLAMVTQRTPVDPSSITLTIESTVPVHPVRFTVVGAAGLVGVSGDSLRTMVDTVVASTPARITVGHGPVRVVVQTVSGEPWLLVSSAELGKFEAWANRFELRRGSTGATLRVLAPAMRWSTH